MRNRYVDVLSQNGQGNSFLEEFLKPKTTLALGLAQTFASFVLVFNNFKVAR